MPSVPTSSDTRVTSLARVDSCATMELTVILRSSISPCTSTLTVRLRSPSATALVTSEMERTWSVKLLAIFCGGKQGQRREPTQVGTTTNVDIAREVSPSALDPIHPRLSAKYTLRTDLQGDARDLGSERAQLIHHGIHSRL